jgi:hypothetical protein
MVQDKMGRYGRVAAKPFALAWFAAGVFWTDMSRPSGCGRQQIRCARRGQIIVMVDQQQHSDDLQGFIQGGSTAEASGQTRSDSRA